MFSRWRALSRLALVGVRHSTSSMPPKLKAAGTDKTVFSWKSALIAAGIGAGFVGYVLNLKQEKKLAIEKERKRALGKASLGGNFELVDTEGKIRKSEEFFGKWVLIYFGFTHCPDICPEELEKMSIVLEKLANDSTVPPVQGLFISVDPQRDSPEIVGKYVKEFSPRLLGLTGSTEQVEKACKAYRVYFSAGPKDSDADYIVDHTIIMYLIDPKGQFVDYYGQTKNAEDIINSVLLNVAIYDRLNKKTWF